jgi:hypothetical protein
MVALGAYCYKKTTQVVALVTDTHHRSCSTADHTIYIGDGGSDIHVGIVSKAASLFASAPARPSTQKVANG